MALMSHYSKEQLKALANFFIGMAIAWFSGGTIGTYFVTIDLNQKIIYTGVGIVGGHIFLQLALYISKHI